MSTFKSMREEVPNIQFAIWAGNNENDPNSTFISWEILLNQSIIEAIGKENIEIRGIISNERGLQIFFM